MDCVAPREDIVALCAKFCGEFCAFRLSFRRRIYVVCVAENEGVHDSVFVVVETLEFVDAFLVGPCCNDALHEGPLYGLHFVAGKNDSVSLQIFTLVFTEIIIQEYYFRK